MPQDLGRIPASPNKGTDAVKRNRIIVPIVLCLVGLAMVGCAERGESENFFKTGKYRFLSPDKPLAKPKSAQTGWIVSSLTELDKTDDIYPNATRPTEQDYVYSDVDYRIGPGDVMDVSILHLYAQGLETLLRREVSDSGYVDLPQLPQRIPAEGMTQTELTDAIAKAYEDAGLLRDPVVSVTITARRQQTFSIMGAVARPGTYQIVRRDMRLLEALAMSGDIIQSNIEYLYVIRQAPPIRQTELNQPEHSDAVPTSYRKRRTTPRDLQREIGGLLEESASAEPRLLQSYAETGDGPVIVGVEDVEAPPAEHKTYQWRYIDNEWVRVEVDPADAVAPEKKIEGEDDTVQPAKAPAQAPQEQPEDAAQPVQPVQPQQGKQGGDAADPFGWAAMEKKDLVRVIAINLEKLRQGDYRQNIVVRENDVIRVPELTVGEFYIMGEVLRPGVYSLTGRKVTIKMAMAAAGNLGPFAWPENAMLIRRIGPNQEQMIPINVEKIMRGEDQDIYLKPNDVIAIGTHVSSQFLAVLRNAFRMTYGFGFIYDRNFSDPLLITPRSNRFTRL
jgi:protein involved in polysaccharide export with SLBB domain